MEGTGSYGCGLARHLAAMGVPVVEVIRPNRRARRQRGKSDAADAVAALNGEASDVPKGRHGAAESIRMLRVARAVAVIRPFGQGSVSSVGLLTGQRVWHLERLRSGGFSESRHGWRVLDGMAAS